MAVIPVQVVLEPGLCPSATVRCYICYRREAPGLGVFISLALYTVYMQRIGQSIMMSESLTVSEW